MHANCGHVNGKVERSRRIDAEEFCRLLDGVVEDDTGLFNQKLKEWEDYYNYHRPHGRLGGQTPTNDCYKDPGPTCHRPTSVTHAVLTQCRRRIRTCVGVSRRIYRRLAPRGGRQTCRRARKYSVR